MTDDTTATRILRAWTRLEGGLRAALPVCSVQPPTQPAELLSALRINHQIGPEEESRILALREMRNRVAHDPGDPPEEVALSFEAEVEDLLRNLAGLSGEACG
jgi:hypothetical protein